MADMWTMINRELAKLESARGGASATPQLDILRETMQYAKEDRAWKERKNLQRQQIMSELGRGTSMTFNDEDLKRKKERFQNYYNKHKGNMDENTLEMGQFMLDDFDIQGEKNKDFNKFLLDGEQFNKDMVYDMQNIGYDIDEEGNKVQRTLNEDDWQLITDMQHKWIKHTADGQTQFADRLALKPFAHINTQLTNSSNANQFLLQQAREDNIIDDQELQVYMDAWGGLNTDGIDAYNAKQAAVDGTILKTSGEGMIQDMQSYEEMYNFLYGTGEMAFNDTAFPDGKFIGNAAQYAKGKNITLENLQDSWMTKLENLDKKIANADENVFQKKSQGISLMGDSNFIRHGDRDFGGGVLTTTPPPGDPTKTEEVVEKVKEGDGGIGQFISDYKNELAVGGMGVAVASQFPKVQQVTKGAVDYLKNVTKLPSEDLTGLLKDSDFKTWTNRIDGQLDKINIEKAKLAKQEIVYPKDKAKLKYLLRQYKQMTDKATDLLGTRYKNIANKDIIKLFKNTDKWNIYKVKSVIGGALKQAKLAGKDIFRLSGKAGVKLSPIEAGIMGWYAGEAMGLGTAGRVGIATTAVIGTKALLNKVSKKGWGNAIANPRLRSKLAGMVIKKAPWLAGKMGLKMGVGALTASTGIGTAFSAAMAAWTLNDIRKIIQDIPEVKQLFVDYTEGKFDEE